MDKANEFVLKAVIFDIDGTLIDSNDAHAQAFVEAFAEEGFQVSRERVRSLIGMGSDQLIPVLLGQTKESERGKRVSDAKSRIYQEKHFPSIEAFRGVPDLLRRLRMSGVRLAVATSADRGDLDAVMAKFGIEEFFERGITSEDAESSKPEPDMILAALGRLRVKPEEAVMVGDTPFDIAAAMRAGVRTVAVRCGGYWRDPDLSEAIAIYDGPWDLFEKFDQSPLAGDPSEAVKAAS